MGIRKMEAAIFVGIALLAVHQTANADTTLDTVSTLESKSLLDTLSEKAALTYFGVYRGGALSNPGGSLTPAIDGTPDPESPQSVENLITAGYRINKTWMIGGIGHFYVYPGATPSGTNAFQMLDPALIISGTNLVNSNGFKLSARMTAQLPATSQDFLRASNRNLATAITPTLVASYEVPNTALTVGLFGYLRGYVPTGASPNDVRTYKIYVAPNFNYQISQTVAATMWVDLIQATRNKGTGFISGIQNAEMDIEPGINWDITKNISINPVLNIYPGNPTLKATSLMAFIVAKAF